MTLRRELQPGKSGGSVPGACGDVDEPNEPLRYDLLNPASIDLSGEGAKMSVSICVWKERELNCSFLPCFKRIYRWSTMGWNCRRVILLSVAVQQLIVLADTATVRCSVAATIA